MGSNKLSSEKSPYLLQHANNPVWWQPWGEETFQLAREENKPIFLSIGYATCHWCHVMERESFEDREVATLLNSDFICIKVDREELPDVDQVYMRVVQGMTGHGGWPMTVVMTPERKPFFGGTYFPKSSVIQLLTQITALWKTQRSDLERQAEQIVSHFAERDPISIDETLLNKDLLVRAAEVAKQEFDPEFGGFGGAPKFPPAQRLRLLLRIYRRHQDPDLLKVVTETLTAMARGGIYDHLGGGFSRYSVDEKWLVPHFEKMLYDNALLSSCYLEAYQVTGNREFLLIGEEILNYVLLDMTDPEGGFYSAEDADSEGEEGKFYVWREEELKLALSKDEFGMLESLYQISPGGNFEGSNILALRAGVSWESKYDPQAVELHRKLLELRCKRIRPLRDDKVLTSWNGLMIDSLSIAFRITGNERYLKSAEKAAAFLRSRVWKDGKLLRRYRDGQAAFTAVLDDYACLISGLLSLYLSSFKREWFDWARGLQAVQDEQFWDSKDGGYLSSTADLIFSQKEFFDGAEPSPNALSALNCLTLNALTLEEQYLEKAKQLLSINSVALTKFPQAFSTLLAAFDITWGGSRELVIASPSKGEGDRWFRDLWKIFSPDLVAIPGDAEIPLSIGKLSKDGKPTVYPCVFGRCEAPIHELAAVKRWIDTVKKY